jgi:hypothetical protein
VAWVDEATLARVGVWTDDIECCDAVEAGAVRRFAQAIMDESPDYAEGAQTRFGGPVAPLLFPNHMLRRPLGAPDLVQAQAHKPDFDGVVPQPGLPPLGALAQLPVVNGGAEFEFYRHALHGERVRFRQRYAEIRETASSKGPLVVVVIEGEVRTAAGEVLLRARRTLLRRPEQTA